MDPLKSLITHREAIRRFPSKLNQIAVAPGAIELSVGSLLLHLQEIKAISIHGRLGRDLCEDGAHQVAVALAKGAVSRRIASYNNRGRVVPDALLGIMGSLS